MNVTTTVPSEVNLEYILPPIALGIYLLYMTVFFVLLIRHPLRLNVGLKMAVRKRWAHHVVADNQAIIAVQTLRNSQNAAGIFASASVVVAFFAFQQAQNLAGGTQQLQSAKFYVLGSVFVAAFLCFGLSVRENDQCG